MATISIANLPAFVGAGGDVGDLLVMVDVSDLSASPRGTTKRISFSQALSNPPGNVTVGGNLIVGGTTQLGTVTAGTWNGSTIGPAFGGTGFTTYGPGDLLHGLPSGALNRLPGNTTAVKQFLTSTGTGSAANAPAWGTIVAADVGPGTFTGAFTFANTLVIGTDPGGAALLRVGGSVRTSGPISVTNTSNNAAPFLGSVFSWTGAGSIDDAAIAAFGSIRLYPGNSSTSGLVVSTTNVIVGADPGGTARLRVGGAIQNIHGVTGEYAFQTVNATTGVNPLGAFIQFSGASPNNATSHFLLCQDNAGTKAVIYSNGGIANFQANNVNFSDASLKDVGAVVDPVVWWDRLAALEVREFKYWNQRRNDPNVGLVAQQVQAIAPELIGTIPTDGAPLLGVYTSDLFHAHIAVTQELQRRVRALEAKIS